MLLAPEDVDIGVVDIVDARQAVEVLALLTSRTYSSCKEEAEERAIYGIGFGVTGVFCDVTASLGFGMRQVLIFSVSAGPLVVPDVEDCAGLWRRLGSYG